MFTYYLVLKGIINNKTKRFIAPTKYQTVRQSDSQTVRQSDSQTIRQSDSQTIRQ